MQQLTPQDAVFLALETEALPAHIGGLTFLDPGDAQPFSYPRFVDFVRERLGACERFSWQLQEVPLGLDRPYWVRRNDFDPAEQVRRVALPAPYSDEELSQLTGMLFERALDRSRPLWEMIVIEGLPGERVALLWKVHHCLMDGASGANLIEQLFDITPDAERDVSPEIRDSAKADRRVDAGAVFGRALRNAAEVGARQRHHVGKATRQAVKGFLRDLGKPREEPQEPQQAATAPAALFNGIVGRRRAVSWSSVSLEDVKRLKSSMSVTVNDVVLAMTSGAMRSYLEARGALPEEPLIATVPVSLRSSDDTSLGNQVADLPVGWATDIEDPVDRLVAIHRSANAAKATAKAGDGVDLVGILSEAILPGALSLFMRGAAAVGDKLPLPGNAVVSNVMLTPFPLYCAGARIEKMVPISMLAPTQGMNITVVSYCGELHFGIVHDPELLPDPWELSGLIPKSLQALQSAVDQKIAAEAI